MKEPLLAPCHATPFVFRRSPVTLALRRNQTGRASISYASSNITAVIARDDEHLALTPAAYLSGGFRDARGHLRWELTTTWATAGATRMQSVSPQELGTTLMAMAQVMPLHDSAPAAWYRNACAQAYALTAGA